MAEMAVYWNVNTENLMAELPNTEIEVCTIVSISSHSYVVSRYVYCYSISNLLNIKLNPHSNLVQYHKLVCVSLMAVGYEPEVFIPNSAVYVLVCVCFA